MIKDNFNQQELEGQEIGADEGFASSGGTDEGGVNVSDGTQEDGDKSAEVADDAGEWKDKYMRLSAEFDNYRKRTLKEKMELVSMGGEDVIKSMLPVLDDMDRAIDAMQTSEDIEAVRSGIALISHKLREMLKGKGLAEIDCVGQPLDTDLHEAVAKIPSQDAGQKGRIVDVAQKGYSLKDKVIRHAKVVVGE